MLNFKPVCRLIAAALAAAAIPGLAQERVFSRTIFFGDSLTDAGFFTPLLTRSNPQAAILGRFTTNPGLVWSEVLADRYGTDASMAWTATGAAPRPGNGSNYAVGGARITQDETSPLGPIPSLATQVDAYLGATGGVADREALYTVWGGANDLFAAAHAPSQAQQIITTAVTAQTGLIGALKTAGAQYLLVPNIPDVGLAPDFRGDPATSSAGTALAVAYNQALFNGLAEAGVGVIPVDTFGFLQEVVADPGVYGFGNVTIPACLPRGSQSLTCSPANYAAADAFDRYLFADGVHPAGRAHGMIAQLANAMIQAPRQIALLPHVAKTVGRARADMVAAQMTPAQRGDDAARWWLDGRYDGQRYGHDGSADWYDGGGSGFTVGVDWTRDALVYGAFAGYSNQVMDWGLRGGDFRQADTTLGGYLGWSNKRVWVNAQLSYSRLNYDLQRQLQIGPATRGYNSSVNGANVSVAINAGYRFGEDVFRHGPVLGIVAQRIDIDGFGEERPHESTSLAYADQSANSLMTSVGWQASWELSERFVPFVRTLWYREFNDDPRQVATRAQSIPGSLPYRVPGLEFDNSFANTTIGLRSRLWSMELMSAITISLAQRNGSDSSLFLTLRKAL